MHRDTKHINQSGIGRSSEQLFANGTVHWEKSKEAVWDDMFASKVEKNAKKSSLFSGIPLSIAASLILVMGISVLFFYSKNIVCPAGEHMVVVLPDGSQVNLNASSHVTYKPFTYFLKRELHFEGEGFFEVEKGKPFVVKSDKAQTQVLGTSFNIFTRDGEYKITCLTGKVKISSSVNNSAILNPKDYAEVTDNGLINIINNYNTSREISWRKNEFFYTGEPLSKVIKEIERQYGVSINMNPGLDYNVSINFKTNPKIEEVLDYVCKPRLFTFEKDMDGEYTIVKNN